MSEDDALRYKELARQCVSTSSDAVDAMEKLLTTLKACKETDADGISLLKVKNYELVAYMSELTLMMSKMLKGEKTEGTNSIDRALKHRVIIEKIKPIEDKMKPQIEKLLNQKKEQKGTMKVRLDQMDVKDGEGSDEEDEEEANTKTKKYTAPKIRAVHYEEEEDRPNKDLEKAKRRAMQSSLIMELKNQFSDAPEEIREMSERKFEYDRKREKYEEDNFVRLRQTREQKQKSANLGRAETLDDILSFGDYMMRGEDGNALKRRRTSSAIDGKKWKKAKSDKKKVKTAKDKHKKKMIRRRQ